MSEIPAELLDTPVSDVDVATIAANHLKRWEELWPFLELTEHHEIDVRNTFKEYSEQRRQTLLKWRKIKGSRATYRALIAAATAASNQELVDNVETMLRTRTGNTT